MTSLVGSIIGGYRLLEEIGQGGMATVYKAYQPKLDRWVAVKILDPVYAIDNMETVTRFRREARAIASLRHPNILSIFDYGEHNGVEFFVTEYVSGGSLEDRMRDGPLPPTAALSLAISIGDALAFAHSRGIIHRDVKPANILLGREDWPLLADFGLAKLLEERQRLTDPGAALGTPEYTSPEQALGETIDHRTDIYSLGIVLFEMVTGKPPFQAGKPFDILLMHLNQQPPRVKLGAGIPVSNALNQVIHRALAKKPDGRYPHVAEMVSDLIALSGQTGGVDQSNQAPVGVGPMEIRDQAGPYFLVRGTEEHIEIPTLPSVLLGRTDPSQHLIADIDLSRLCQSSTGISRRHARLICGEGGWHIEDLHSTNGTYLNGRPLPPIRITALRDGDLVQIGKVELVFRSR